ncbi:MAG: helix-turn-helix domain-containing protein [Bacteroidales bacterium]|nr:helix-turn-helix domain-containing protein [Bacteroidales bacterium]
MDHIHREITPLKENDCFLVFDRHKTEFNFPIHFHPEYEINFISGAKGAKRIVGDHMGEIENLEMVLVGPNLYHCWENFKNERTMFNEITIQFPRDLFSKSLLEKNILTPIRELLNNAQRGILFSEATAKQVQNKILMLGKKQGFDSFLELQSLLYDLAISRSQKLLTNMSFQRATDYYNSERIEKVYNYVKVHYKRKIKLEEVADLLNISIVSFSRFIKHRTGKTFVDFVNEVRLGFATRLLIETNKSIAEICYECGFNNISNFNRTFKRKQGRSPSEFRSDFMGVRNVY